MSEREHAMQLLSEARDWPEGSDEWTWRIRAAWKYQQSMDGLPVADWTDWPPQDGLNRALGREQIAA